MRSLAPLLLALGLAGLWACGPGEPQLESAGQRPNVILIVVDTLRQDALGCTGNGRELTPNLDRLAAEGILFTGARSSSPWTLPAHASLFTSQLPSQHGLVVSKRRMPEHCVTLAQALRDSGWSTAAFTDGGFVRPVYGLMKGFQHVHVSPDSANKKGERFGVRHITKRALGWIRKQEEPFFAFLHTYEVHSPFDPSESYRERFVRPYAGRLPRVPDLRAIKEQVGEGELDAADYQYLSDLYEAGVAYTDEVLGEFLQALEAEGLDDSTMIIVTSDHGEELGEHGVLGHSHWLFESLLRVPLIVRHPELYSGGVTVADPVRLEDIAPSILELAEVPIPDSWIGVSLRESGEPRDFLASVSHGERQGAPNSKLEDRTSHAIFDGEAKWMRHASAFEQSGTPGLEPSFEHFDLALDPGESHNLLESPASQEVAERFRLLLERYPQGATALRGEHSPEELERLKALGYTE